MTTARVGDISHNYSDCCGCPGCCHDVQGPAISGSHDSFLNGRAVLRANGMDNGVHCCCCGANNWRTMQGSSDVYLNGLPEVRLFDKTRHCGGIGQIETSSEDTNMNY